jgi:acyl carrier protein
MDKLELEIKKLIVETLKLDDINPSEINSDEALFGEGLGLDSIDALELGVALRKHFSLKIDSVTNEIKEHFFNVRRLSVFIQSQQTD